MQPRDVLTAKLSHRGVLDGLVGQTDDLALLGSAAGPLAEQVGGDFATKLCQGIVESLGPNSEPRTTQLMNAIASLRKEIDDGSAATLARQVLDRLEGEQDDTMAAALGAALAYLADGTQQDYAVKGARNLLNRLKSAEDNFRAAALGSALGLLIHEAPRDLNTRDAEEIANRLKNDQNPYTTARLASALAPLAREGHENLARAGPSRCLIYSNNRTTREQQYWAPRLDPSARLFRVAATRAALRKFSIG